MAADLTTLDEKADAVFAAVKGALGPLEARLEALEDEKARVKNLVAGMEPGTSLAGIPDEVEARLAALETKGRNWLLRLHDKIKGYRTIVFGALVAVAPELADQLGGVDWVNSLGMKPGTAVAIGSAIVALRVITRGAVPALSRGA